MTCPHYEKIVQRIIISMAQQLVTKDPSLTMMMVLTLRQNVTCCQNSAKTVSDVEVDLETLNQVD